MTSPNLVFPVNRHNTNSVAALTGAVDTHPKLGDVQIHFVWWDRQVAPKLSRLLQAVEPPRWLALSFMTAHRERARDLLHYVRTNHWPPEQLKVVAGGPHPSGDPQDVLDIGADAVVFGEGEWTFTQLLQRWRVKGPVDDLPGLVPHTGQRNPRPAPIELDDYPPFSIRHGKLGPIEISRGCPFACRFCQTPYLSGGKMRHRTAETVADTIRRALPHGYSYARFVTPNAFGYGSPDGKTVNLDAVEELLVAVNRLLPRERIYFGSFPSEVRPEAVSPEAVTLVRRYAGNDNLVLGAQTGSPRLLAALKRGHTVEDVYRATEITRQGGLRPIIDFMFGLPGETPEDVELTIRAIQDLTAMGGIIHSHTFMPLPGTPFAQSKPGHMPTRFHSLLDKLASEGKHFGRWRKQAAGGAYHSGPQSRYG